MPPRIPTTTDKKSTPMAHRESGFYEVPCRHHPLGCPTALDRLGRAFGWYVVVGTIAYFAAHVLVAAVR